MPSTLPAFLRTSMVLMSSAEGVWSPLGWLWAMMMLAALWSRAPTKTSAGRMTCLLAQPAAMRPPWLNRPPRVLMLPVRMVSRAVKKGSMNSMRTWVSANQRFVVSRAAVDVDVVVEAFDEVEDNVGRRWHRILRVLLSSVCAVRGCDVEIL